MTPDDRRRAWLEREMRDENMLRAMRQGALDHGWVLSYREAQEVAEAMLPALAALLDAPLRELEEAMESARTFLKAVEHIHSHSGAMNATQLAREDHYRRTEKAICATLARLPWREEPKP